MAKRLSPPARPEQAARPILQVGERLRELRLARGWTLRDLARESGVSVGMLSKLESRSVNPSLAVIERLADVFGLGVARFLGEEDDEARHEVVLLARRDHRVTVHQATGYTREELSPALHGRGIEFIRSTVQPGTGPLVFPPHAPNVEELIFVAQGQLRVAVGRQSYVLEAGDSIFLKPSARHAYENAGSEPCVFFVIIDSHLAT